MLLEKILTLKYDEYMTVIQSYRDEIKTDFNEEGLPPEKTKSITSTILIDSVFRIDKTCYPQELLEECKHKIKEKTVKTFITEDL